MQDKVWYESKRWEVMKVRAKEMTWEYQLRLLGGKGNNQPWADQAKLGMESPGKNNPEYDGGQSKTS